MRSTAVRGGQDFYSVYHKYDEIISWINALPNQYPGLASVVNLGSSYEGRQLLAVKVTATNNATKSAIWFDGCIHAREWITTASVVYMLGNLLSNFTAGEPVARAILTGLEVWVLPIFNPDGYDYTWTTDRMWRKTRSPNADSTCVGTDPNRNWDDHWGGAGSSTDPCDDIYGGASAFSEVEVRTVGQYLTKNAPKFQGYINFHSYSQLWMSPWGWTSDNPPDYPKQNALSESCVNALTSLFGTQYQYGTIANTIYPAAGSSADYTYDVSKTLYSYGVELRDTGQYGFLLPADQIVPSGQETYLALVTWAQQVLKDFPPQFN